MNGIRGLNGEFETWQEQAVGFYFSSKHFLTFSRCLQLTYITMKLKKKKGISKTYFPHSNNYETKCIARPIKNAFSRKVKTMTNYYKKWQQNITFYPLFFYKRE